MGTSRTIVGKSDAVMGKTGTIVGTKAAMLGVMMVCSALASAQTTCFRRWMPTEVPDASNGITSLLEWDADGAGPLRSILVAGRVSQERDELPHDSVIAWDGARWGTLGAGFSGSINPYNGASIYALAEFAGELITAGTFGSADGVPCRGIAAWNGSAWRPLGPGIEGNVVAALGIFNGELIAAGRFDTAGGVPATNIAAWNGSAWRPLATSMTGNNNQTNINAVCIFGNRLIAAGYFTSIGGVSARNIAAWDGAQWLPLGSGIGGNGEVVYALRTYHDTVVAGGAFTTAGGLASVGIARWNGSVWSPVGYGVMQGSVQTLGEFDGCLIAGGNFSLIDVVAARGIAAWDEVSWWRALTGPAGLGLNPYTGGAYVTAISSFRNTLYVSGLFERAGPLLSQNWAAWGCCPADTDDGSATGTRDGGVGVEDLLFYLGLYEAGTTAADIDDGSSTGSPDGGVGIEDLLYYLQRYDAGC